LTFSADYAFSHSFTNRYLGDYYSADSALVDFTSLRSPHLNRVPSPCDLRHVFRAYFTYDLPFGAGKAFNTGNGVLNGIVGGWTVGSVFTWQVGRNFKLAGGQDTHDWFDSYNVNNSAGYPPDPNDSGVVLNEVTPAQLQSKVGVHYTGNAFLPVSVLPASLFGPGGAIQPESTPGVLGSTVFLRGPQLVNTDLSIVKDIPIWERLKFNIYAEMLNVFNRPNCNFTDGYSYTSNNPAQYLFGNIPRYAPGTVGQNGNGQIQFRLQLTF
jgi:hypothetical protein